MATVEDCRRALDELSARLESIDPEVRRRHALDRRLSCRVTDLDVTYLGQLRDGGLYDVELVPDDGRPDAQIRLSLTSEDLVLLTGGQLNFATAWARGRLKIEASMMDLLKLRTLM